MGERRGTKGLELWCRKMTEGYPGVKIDNMTTSWRDGLAFCAIIHHFRPDLIDFEKLNKDDVYHNNELAFRVAEHHLGIPALLEPEDMVEYTVPDRLSILTYLSQFYQAFAVPQGSSSARIAAKRPQTSPDHGIVSPASTSPPTKVAFTGAGKIRREPCAKCGLPVFIAERLNVGKLLYHRTCFRCARCNSQLTLANYYETEGSEYCCEICPDEEKLALRSSPEKSVLSRSMSDEEKTANLKTFTNEPDGYSALFETALENIPDDSIKNELPLAKDESSEFTKARSEFFRSQMEDSGNEEEPPDLPTSTPPELDKSELKSSDDAISLKDTTIVTNSALGDSGFPNNRLDEIVNMDSSKSSVSNQYVNASVELDKTHNIVTKDRPAEEGDTSLVKARMRLFESNKSTDVNDFRKSDVHRNSQNTDKVPLTPDKSPTHHSQALKSTSIPIVKLDDLENFEQLSKKDLENVIDDNKISTDKPTVPIAEDSFKHSNDNISDKYISEKTHINTMKNTIATVSVFDKKQETDTKHIVTRELSPPSRVKDLVAEPEGKINDGSKTDDSILSINNSEESENSAITVEDSPIAHLQNADISLSPAITIDSSAESNFHNLVPQDSFSNFHTVVSPDSFSEYKTTNVTASPKGDSSPDDKSRDEQEGKPSDEDYPDDLNPFDEEEEKHEQKRPQANAPFNPFEDDDDDEEVVLRPVPSPRLAKKKLLPNDSDTIITGTPEHLSGVIIKRISVNPFESDDEECDKSDGKPPMPAARKKKVIPAPKISLNPFWSEDEENDNNVKQPVPKPRTSRTTLGVPEPKPRESGGLSLSTRSNFGSNSSISSGSAYGSVRRKKPAPQPPATLAKSDYYESTTSSLASSPCHSVQHSPRLNQKYRKSKKAPPPPISSTPVPPRKLEPEASRLSSTALSPIHFDSSESAVKDNAQEDMQNDIEQEKIVKDEMNRNKQSQNIGLQSPTDSETSSSISAPNKSTYGKWKRRKGQAPTRPIPQKRSITCLPMTEIRRELEVIEIQQQGLERQGVRLEQIIREKCEGTGVDSTTNTDDSLPIDVEDLILQLFELVNEKNDLFRKQAELMYLRRQQRLEEEHADVEYQIRCLMLQPEANKTDSDKAREEELINRLVEIVERRNEIIECLEMDRVREAEEEDSINNHINLYTLKRDGEKLELDKSKKEKEKDKKKHKKEKKSKYKDKGHKIDADKDIDESEPCSTLEKRKKKKFNIF